MADLRWSGSSPSAVAVRPHLAMPLALKTEATAMRTVANPATQTQRTDTLRHAKSLSVNIDMATDWGSSIGTVAATARGLVTTPPASVALAVQPYSWGAPGQLQGVSRPLPQEAYRPQRAR
jgi:hypothetical protein